MFFPLIWEMRISLVYRYDEIWENFEKRKEEVFFLNFLYVSSHLQSFEKKKISFASNFFQWIIIGINFPYVSYSWNGSDFPIPRSHKNEKNWFLRKIKF